MSWATKVEREKHWIDPIGDLTELRCLQVLLIDSVCYEKLTPRQRNKLIHHASELEIYIKEFVRKVVRQEQSVKPIKILNDRKETNHQYYERHKNKQDGTTTYSTGLSEGILEEL